MGRSDSRGRSRNLVSLTRGCLRFGASFALTMSRSLDFSKNSGAIMKRDRRDWSNRCRSRLVCRHGRPADCVSFGAQLQPLNIAGVLPLRCSGTLRRIVPENRAVTPRAPEESLRIGPTAPPAPLSEERGVSRCWRPRSSTIGDFGSGRVLHPRVVVGEPLLVGTALPQVLGTRGQSRDVRRRDQRVNQ